MKRYIAAALAAVFAAAVLCTPQSARADLPMLAATATLSQTHPSLTFASPLSGQGSCSVAIASNAESDTIDFYVSVNGSDFVPAALADYSGGSAVTSATSGTYHGDCSAVKQFKIALASPTSGSSATVGMLAGQASSTLVLASGSGGISSIIGTSPIGATTVSGTTTITCSTCLTSASISGTSPISVATPSAGTFVIGITDPLPVGNGGTGTDSPATTGGNCINVTGTWPNDTIAYSCATPGPTPTPTVVTVTGTSPIVVATPGTNSFAISAPTALTSLTCSANVVCGTGTTPTVQVTANPTFSGVTVGSLAGCVIANSGTLGAQICGATVTTAGVVIPSIGSTVSVPVSQGSGFPNLAFVQVSDGTHSFTGQITSGGTTNTLTVNVLSIPGGSAGDTVASGGILTNSGPTYAAGTGLTLNSSNVFGLSTPVAIANGGTNATSLTANRCLRYNGTSIVSASADCSTTPTLSAELSIGLGFASGTVSTATVYPYQQVANYTNGKLTKLRVACATADSGQTIFSLSQNGSSIATIQMTNGSATASSTTGFPVSISPGDVLHLAATQAGTATDCGVTVDGTQQTF